MIRAMLGLLCLVASISAASTTLVHNIRGYTMNDGVRMEFVAIEYNQGKITRLLTNSEEVGRSQADTRIDGKDAILLPGLIDAHGHITSHGRAFGAVDLIGSATEAEAGARVAAYIAANPEKDWVLGRGWNQVLWPGKAFPSSTLDISSDLGGTCERNHAYIRVFD